jgi:serine/threonine-protein kinase
VRSSGWELHNTGRWLTLRVVGLDRSGLDTVPPGRSLVVPWAVSRIEIVVGSRCHGFGARWSASGAVPAAGPIDVGGDEVTTAPVRLDRDSGCFRALVALCEPKLRDPSADAVATDAQIAWRLNRLDVEQRRLSPKTVERRLDYCRTRFGLKTDEWGAPIAPDRRDPRRRLADAALLSGLVSELDLVVLDGGVDARR